MKDTQPLQPADNDLPVTPPDEATTSEATTDEATTDAATTDAVPNGESDDDMSEPVKLETEAVLLQQVLDYKAAAQRATADYRNLQRDTEQRLSDMRKFSNEQLLAELCPLVDYFDSAFAVIPEDQKSVAWVQGVKHIQTYLMQVLKTNGVERMTTVGQVFNPELHESVGEEESNQPEHTIIKELQAGFTLQGKAMRHARVVIAKASAAAPPAQADETPAQTETTNN